MAVLVTIHPSPDDDRVAVQLRQHVEPETKAGVRYSVAVVARGTDHGQGREVFTIELDDVATINALSIQLKVASVILEYLRAGGELQDWPGPLV